jgi:tellurite resistance protein TerC
MLNLFGTDVVFWIVFNTVIVVMLLFDLGVLSRRAHVVSTREAAIWSSVWIAVSLSFNYLVYSWFGAERAFEFLTGYLIEKSLSVDNMFVFVLIFAYFNIPQIWHARVLKWGIIGALVTRAVLIIAGAAVLQAFHWMIYIFGGVLIVTGARMMIKRETHIEPEKNPILKLFKRIMPVTGELHNEKFLVRLDGFRHATPLLLTLIVVETTDIIFAVDSIPAIFAITTNIFIVYTSNIFAILGLRALYFLLAGVVQRFGYLKLALAVILVFVGVKMIVSDFYKIPIAISLSFVLGILAISMFASWLSTSMKAAKPRYAMSKLDVTTSRSKLPRWFQVYTFTKL